MLPHYAFWQISEQCIEARPKDSQSRWFSTALKIQMLPTGLARVRKELAEEGPEGPELLDATRASPSSELSVFAERLSRVEPLSHILLWTGVSLEKDSGAAVDLVEMPRLQLRFRLREGPVIRDSGDGDGPKVAFEPKLFCDAYGGQLYLEATQHQAIRQLLPNCPHALPPHCLLLRSESGEAKA